MTVLFIDGMGQGILFPILGRALLNPLSTELIAHVGLLARDVWYGIIIGIFFICAFLGTAILGDLSDRVGRKKTLIICLLGSAIGFFMSASSFYLHNIYFLLLGRIIDGFTAGSQAIANAATIDIVDESHKTRYLGYILLAVSLGIIIGPLLGGFLSNPHLVSWFNDSIPLFVAGTIAVVNVIFLQLCFTDTRQGNKARRGVAKAFYVFVEAFQLRPLKVLLCGYFLMQMGVNAYYMFASVFLASKFHMPVTSVSLLIGLMGVSLTLGLAFVVKWLEGRCNIFIVVVMSYLIYAFGLLITAQTVHIILLWIVVVPMFIAFAVGVVFMNTIFSQQVSVDKQGWVMGISGGVSWLGIGATNFVSGILSSMNIHLPLYTAIIEIVIGCLLVTSVGYRYQSDCNS